MRLLCFAVLLILYTFSFIEYFPSIRKRELFEMCMCTFVFIGRKLAVMIV